MWIRCADERIINLDVCGYLCLYQDPNLLVLELQVIDENKNAIFITSFPSKEEAKGFMDFLYLDMKNNVNCVDVRTIKALCQKTAK